MRTHIVYNRNGNFAESLDSSAVLEYQHEHMEGPYIASFVLEAEEGGITDTKLLQWFENYLMYEFATNASGSEVWRGYIWEMQLEMDGEVAIMSMEDMANAVKCRYTNNSGG